MIALDIVQERARRPLWKHQLAGVRALCLYNEPSVGRVEHGCFALFDKQATGKTKQAIDAMQLLAYAGEIDTVLVITLSEARGVWFNPEFGELAKHLWENWTSEVYEWHQRVRRWTWPGTGHPLKWVITNYQFVRSARRFQELVRVCGPKTYLLLDESSAIKNHRAEQTKAVAALRKLCGRVALLNGTPTSSGSPVDLFAQTAVMAPMGTKSGRGFGGSKILHSPDFIHYRSRYAIMGGAVIAGRPVQILGWRHDPEPGCCDRPVESQFHGRPGIQEIQKNLGPYCLRRLKDVLDLPPKLSPKVQEVYLTSSSWSLYKEVRDDLCAWLDAQTVAVSHHAGQRVLRLAQICAGHLGGLEDADGNLLDEQSRYVGREKLDSALEWASKLWAENPNVKLLFWCRFRPELDRLATELALRARAAQVGRLWGGQKVGEREAALRLLKPEGAPAGPAALVAITSCGARAQDFVAAHDVMYCSNGTSYGDRDQADDRVHRYGQTDPVSYTDLVACGPGGQKTIDHALLHAMHGKINMSEMTCRAWAQVLREE